MERNILLYTLFDFVRLFSLYFPGDEEDDDEEDDEREEAESNGVGSEGSVDLMVEASKLKGRKREEGRLICAVCLGDTDSQGDEIVECDGCGVSVHECCYGISESTSVASTNSSSSTEPWFCEACKADNARPFCQLCPNRGGVFKETDVGQWVHLTCALFVPGIAFGDPDGLSSVTLFEMSYGLWGAKTCSLCTEEYLSKTGVCIGCDAALCKAHFHVTCALREGLLHYPHEEEHFGRTIHTNASAQQQDLYYAHCLLHAEKMTRIQKKTNFLALQGQIRQRMEAKQKQAIASSQGNQEEKLSDEESLDSLKMRMSEDDRLLAKLRVLRAKYNRGKIDRPSPWVPTQKMPRLISTSPSAVRRLFRKAELMGIHTPSLMRTLKQQESLGDVHKKWHLPPAFTVEYIGYFFDRSNRMIEFKNSLASGLKRNSKLDKEEKEKRKLYSEKRTEMSLHKDRMEKKRQIVGTFVEFLSEAWGGQQQVQLPMGYALSLSDSGTTEEDIPVQQAKPSQKVAPKPVRKKEAEKVTPSTSSAKVVEARKKVSAPPRDDGPLKIVKCAACHSEKDQALLLACDVCQKSYHLACLDPPLSRMPKKTKLYGWQCSDCLPESTDEELEKVDADAPRQLRTKISKPKKFRNGAADPEDPETPVAAPAKVKKQASTSAKRSASPSTSAAEQPKKRFKLITPRAPQPEQETEQSSPVRDPDLPAELPRVRPPQRVYKKQDTDKRTNCHACNEAGDNESLVRCDECRRCFHFSCLDPPCSKSPKRRGYSWYCQDCDLPSDAEEEKADEEPEASGN